MFDKKRMDCLLLNCLFFLSVVTSSADAENGYFSSGIPWLSLPAAEISEVWITDFGNDLRYNKGVVSQAIKDSGANQQESVLIMAIAMLETTKMSPFERDGLKDNKFECRNYSLLNLNHHMLNSIEATLQSSDKSYVPCLTFDRLNDIQNLKLACWYLVVAFRIYGIEGTLNFHRGGSKAFDDHVSFNAEEYRSAILTIYNKIAEDLSLMYDSRRVEIRVSYQ